MINNRFIYDNVFELMILFFGLVYAGLFSPFNWWIIPIVSTLLFLLEQRRSIKSNLKIALLIGFFLLVFDFAFENTGTLIFGSWGTKGSFLFILAVPTEVMITCFFGGAWWAQHFISVYSQFTSGFQGHANSRLRFYLIGLDLFFFGIGGAIAEWFLIQRGIMYYANGWNSIHAFIAYLATWLILHILLYVLIKRTS
ncbi:MAG: hypothetical protein V1850_02505 [Candidatus Bathyarchaeota archaeon]